MTTESEAVPASGLAILIWAATTDRADLVVTPLVHALAARALDCAVEIHFAGPAARWLVEGIAAASWPTPDREKSVLQWLHDCAAAGVDIRICGMARAGWIRPGETLIAECHGAVGATAFVARGLDPGWRCVVF